MGNKTSFEVNPETGIVTIELGGRLRWALEQLMKAGAKGVTPLENPALRWAAYVHRLRELGIDIETKTERHAKPFAGNHARYVLRSQVRAVK